MNGNWLAMGLILFFSVSVLAVPTMVLSTNPTTIYSTSKIAASYKVIQTYTGLNCAGGNDYEFRSYVPVNYDLALLDQTKITAIATLQDDSVKEARCTVDAGNKLVSCLEFKDLSKMQGLKKFELELSLTTNTDQGNPVRTENWSTQVSCVQSAINTPLTQQIQVLAPEIILASPLDSTVNGKVLVGALEVPGKGIPHFVKLVVEHPSDIVPEKSDADRGDLWLIEFDSTTVSDAQITLKLFPCDYKLVCGSAATKTVTIKNQAGTEPEQPKPVNQAPKIVIAYPDDPDRVLNENQITRFVAEVIDENLQALKYSWGFGDGEKSLEEKPFHSYSLDAGKTKQNFTVKLNVSDGEFDANYSFDVVVETVSLKLEIISPVKQEFERKEEIPIRVSLTDSNDNPVKGSFNAFISSGERKEIISLNEVQTGIYEANYAPNYRLTENSFLHVEATAEINFVEKKAVKEKPIAFKPAKLNAEIELSPAPPYGINAVIEKAKLKLFYPDGTELKAEDLDLSQLKLGFNGKEFSLSNELEAEIRHSVAKEDFEKGLKLKLEGKDKYGNTVNKEFPIELIQAQGKLEVKIIEPMQEIYGLGQELKFAVELRPEQEADLNLLKGKEVVKSLSLNQKTGLYEASYIVPEEAKEKELEFTVVAANADGITAFDSKKIKLTNKVKVEFVYPVQGLTEGKEKNKIGVKLFYPNGEEIERGQINAVIELDERSQEIVLKKNLETGNYEAELSEALLTDGNHSISLSLKEVYAVGEEKIVSTISSPSNLGIAILLVAVIAGVIVIGYALALEKKKAGKENQQERRHNLKELMKRLKYEYYKRHITAAEYREKLLEYDQELKTIEKKIGKELEKEKPAEEKPEGLAEAIRDLDKKTTEELIDDEELAESIELELEQIREEKEREKIPEEELPSEEKPLLDSFYDYLKGVQRQFQEIFSAKQDIEEKLEKKFSEGEREEIKRLVFLLRKQKAKYSRQEIVKTILGEGYTERVAEKVVELLYKN